MAQTTSFLRWAGGKNWLANRIVSMYHESNKQRYIDPFFGGGSVFFKLQPDKAILADTNKDLIATYLLVRNQPNSAIKRLSKLDATEQTYYDVRKSIPRGRREIAVRFLYLNRCSYGGIWRVNKSGQYNVPFGNRHHKVLIETPILKDASKALKKIPKNCFSSNDFEMTIDLATSEDFVFCDPPYTVARNNNGFVNYNEVKFSWKDQVRLAEAANRARARGAKVIITNAAHASIRELYSGWNIETVYRENALAFKKHKAQEFLIT